MSTILTLIANVFALLRWIAEFVSAEKNKQAGRDEVNSQVNKEAADAEKRMAEVPDNPSDDDVSSRMRDGSFVYGSQDQLPDDKVLRQGDSRGGGPRIPTFASIFGTKKDVG